MGKIKNIKGQEAIDAETMPVPTEENTETQAIAPETDPATQQDGDAKPEKKSILRKIGDKIIDADEKKKQKKADKETAKAKKQAEKADAAAKGNGAGRALKIGAAIGAGALILGSITKAVLDASASNTGTDVIQELPGEPAMLSAGEEGVNESPSQREEASPVVETKEDTQSN